MALKSPNAGAGAYPPVVLIYNNTDGTENLDIDLTLPVPEYCSICKQPRGDCHRIRFEGSKPLIDNKNGEVICLSCMELEREKLEKLEKEAKK